MMKETKLSLRLIPAVLGREQLDPPTCPTWWKDTDVPHAVSELWLECEFPPYTCVLNAWSSAVELIWEVVESLGSGFKREEVGDQELCFGCHTRSLGPFPLSASWLWQSEQLSCIIS